mgnify:CR=1 FL=1
MAKLNCVTVLAPAKLNLALDVVGLLPNGYHNLDMTMQAITLYERVVLRRSQNLSLTLPGSPVAANDSNTAIKAALAFFHYTGLLAGVEITIYKNVPVRAGMAGGSADAAKAQHGSAVGYNADKVGVIGIDVKHCGIFMDFHARFGNAGRIRQGEVVVIAHRGFDPNLNLALVFLVHCKGFFPQVLDP